MDLVNFIRKYSLFGIIPEKIIDQFFSKLNRQRFPRRTIILNSFEKNDYLYMIIEGKVRVVTSDERGVEIDLDNLKGGEIGRAHV